MVMELRVALRFTQDELMTTTAELTLTTSRLIVSETEILNLKKLMSKQTVKLMQAEAELKVVNQRLAVTETDMKHVTLDVAAADAGLAILRAEVMELTANGAAQDTELMLIKTRQNTSETQIDNLIQVDAAQWAELTEDRLAATDAGMEKMRSEMLEKPKVAFSVGLLESSSEIQAGNSDRYLVYSNIFTNIGQAYSKITGFFTAPVKGVYYFRFTGMYYANGYPIGLMMYKNEEKAMYLSNSETDDRFTYLSSGLTLQLEVGDKVHMRLRANCRIYDDENNHSIFSGFLLFPL
ncbi:hypothetical protein ACEWY4_022893 [Coilia grayii]|uniref:C1q domain-containing protein n=1 Tax=Coilia grayii TaxID=363190 RepID=A0ABD1J3G1_9TELE